LQLRALDDVLHVDAHFVHRAGHFIDALAASTLTLADSVDAPAIWADPVATPVALSLFCSQVAEPIDHPQESVGHRVTRRPRSDGYIQLASAIAEEALAISFR